MFICHYTGNKTSLSWVFPSFFSDLSKCPAPHQQQQLSQVLYLRSALQKPVAAASHRSGRMIDRRWPRLPCCWAALLSWGATTRRAQQRSHRCNFGELDKLHFVKKEISQERSFCVSAPGSCACVRACVFGGGTTLSLSFCVSGQLTGVFRSRRWARLKCPAGEDTGVESRPAVPPSASRIKMKIL